MHVGVLSSRRMASVALAFVLAFASPVVFAAELTISAAASLGDAFRDIGRAFESAHPDTKVQLNFAASGALLQQIAKGAPVDVFASADEETMDRAEQQKLIRHGSRVDFAANALVVVVPRDAASSPKTLADLAATSIRRIAIGLPASVPAGRYARFALDKAKLWPAIEAKVIGAQSVRQGLDYVARGEVDAGFVYATDAALEVDKVRVAFVVPTDPPVRYPIAIVEGSGNLAAARGFVAFVASLAGQDTMARYGFGKP